MFGGSYEFSDKKVFGISFDRFGRCCVSWGDVFACKCVKQGSKRAKSYSAKILLIKVLNRSDPAV